MGEIIPVTIEQYSQKPPRFRIICCDGGVVAYNGTVELHQQNAVTFEGEDGYEQAASFIEDSPRFVLQED